MMQVVTIPISFLHSTDRYITEISPFQDKCAVLEIIIYPQVLAPFHYDQVTARTYSQRHNDGELVLGF